MTFIERLKQRLNLAADTPDEEVERLAEERLGEGEEEGEGEGTGTPAAAPADGEGQPVTPPVEAAATAPSTVTVDADTWARVQAGAAEGSTARAEQITAENTRLIDEAIRVGKFAPGRREHWEQLLSVDRDGTITTINSLAEDLIPVKERGKSGTTEQSLSVGYPPGLLPDVDAKKARLSAGARPRVMSDR